MPVLSQGQIAEQMVAQIRLLKPTISAEVGTPERLIIDTVAGAIAESSIDLIGLQEALNVDSKFGANLTNFMALFGFNRTEASTATGFVKFSRNTPSNVNIIVPSGVILKSHISSSTDGLTPEFVTTASVTLLAGETETALVPIRAKNPGAIGNVPSEAITIMSFAPVLGITAVTNPSPTTGGSEQEDDNSLKARFKNSVFRNISGTEDQYLALAVSTAFSTKAVVVGPVSKYQEYVQVPAVSDQGLYAYGGGEPFAGYPWPLMVRGSGANGSKRVTLETTRGIEPGVPVEVYSSEDNPKIVGGPTVIAIISQTVIEITEPLRADVEDGWVFLGEWKPARELLVNKWTTALSSNPFAKEVWGILPIFISNSTSGIGKYFFREGVDFEFNYPPKLQGDTLRAMIDGVGPDPRSSFEGSHQPNVTFTNVYLGSEDAVKALSPEDVVLLEYSYTSTSSRNSIQHNVTNAVDVYVDGTNEQSTSTIFAVPLSPISQAFVENPLSMYYFENYRRDGEPTKRPLEGNILTTLYSQPVLKIPDQITVENNKYYLNVHYWLVHDTSGYQGTIRARDGIEWSNTIGADLGGEEEGRPTLTKPEPEYTGDTFTKLIESNNPNQPTLIEVEPYFYDQNIEGLQAALEASRQVTTDLLGHKAHYRYFKLNVTVIYSPQSTASTVNNEIREAVSSFFANQYFGSVIRLSDLLQVIHNVQGVENVRWSNDVPNDQDLIRVWQTNLEGEPLEGVFLDRLKWGNKSEAEVQSLYIVGHPEHGSYKLNFGSGKETVAIEPIESGTDAAELEEHINNLFGIGTVKVEEDVRLNINVVEPIRSFRITYKEVGTRVLPEVVYPANPRDKPYAGGEYSFDSDFFLRDDELPALPTGLQPGDTVPGLIIKSRAQNVWNKG